MRATLIVPVSNGYRNLDACLRALAALNLFPDHVVLVDDGFGDGSYERLTEFPNSRPNVMVLLEAANAILRLLVDPGERRRLGAPARRLVEEHYDWSRCLAPLGTPYAGLLPVRTARC